MSELWSLPELWLVEEENVDAHAVNEEYAAATAMRASNRSRELGLTKLLLLLEVFELEVLLVCQFLKIF